MNRFGSPLNNVRPPISQLTSSGPIYGVGESIANQIKSDKPAVAVTNSTGDLMSTIRPMLPMLAIAGLIYYFFIKNRS